MTELLLDILLPFIGLTWLFTASDGPWDLMKKLRNLVSGSPEDPTFFGKLLACGGCTAFWAGGLVGLVQALPFFLADLGISFAYPMWLAWLVRCPFAAMGFVVVVDLMKPHPPLDLSALIPEEDADEER